MCRLRELQRGLSTSKSSDRISYPIPLRRSRLRRWSSSSRWCSSIAHNTNMNQWSCNSSHSNSWLSQWCSNKPTRSPPSQLSSSRVSATCSNQPSNRLTSSKEVNTSTCPSNNSPKPSLAARQLARSSQGILKLYFQDRLRCSQDKLCFQGRLNLV